MMAVYRLTCSHEYQKRSGERQMTSKATEKDGMFNANSGVKQSCRISAFEVAIKKM